jgi:prolyl oligopeptidase
VVGRTLSYTTWNAPNGRIVAATVGDTSRTGWRDVVPAGENAISESMLVGDRIAIVYLVDVQSRLSLFDLKGAPRGEVKLPEPGTAAGLSGRNDGTDSSSRSAPTSVRPRSIATT